MAESTIFRQVATVEVILIVEPGWEPPPVDLEGMLRDLIQQADFGKDQPWPVAGAIVVGDLERLEVTSMQEPA